LGLKALSAGVIIWIPLQECPLIREEISMRRIGFLAAVVLLLNGVVAPAAFADGPRTIYVRADAATADAITGDSCLQPNYAGSNGLKSAITNAIAEDIFVLCNDSLYENSPNNRTFSLSNTTLTVPATFTSDINNPLRRPKILTNNFIIDTDPEANTTISDMNFESSGAIGNGTNCLTTAACGGAIKLKAGILHLDRMVFAGNGATYGGAIALTSGDGSATLEVDRSSFIGNTATTNGGAIFVSANDTATIKNSVFYTNAVTNGEGAAIFATTGQAEMNFNTIISNSGGSVLNGAGITIDNSILGQRLVVDKLCGESVDIGEGNFITDDSCGSLPAFTSGTQDVSVQIPFGQMRIGRIYEPVSGGLQYFRLLSESPAIDYITFDEVADPSTNISSLSNSRPYSIPSVDVDRADVGSVEVNSSPLLVREFDSELSYSGLIVAEKLSVGGTMIPTSVARIMTPLQTYDVTKKRIDIDGNAIITTQERHDITVGMQIQVSGVGSSLNGLHTVTAVSSRTFSFETKGATLAETNVTPWGTAVHKEKARITYTSLTPDVCTLVSTKNPAIIPQANAGVCEVDIYSPAANGYEEVYEFVSLQMLIQKKSSKPLGVSVAKISKNGATVSWHKPFTTGKAKLLRYEVSFYRASKPKQVRLTLKVSPYKLKVITKKLAVNMPYIVRVRAISAAGKSDPSKDVRFKTKKKK
jgi:predicted outer membrane repeat protein